MPLIFAFLTQYDTKGVFLFPFGAMFSGGVLTID